MLALAKWLLLYFVRFSQLPISGILAALQFMDKVPKPEDGELQIRWQIWNYVQERRFTITAFGIVFVGVLGFVADYLSRPEKASNKVRQTIMEAMLEECLNNDKRNIRITIFKEAGFWRNRWIYVNKCFTSKGGWKTIRHSYLFAWDRLGKPKSSTCFRISDKDERFCEGVAGATWYQESNVEVPNLPDLSAIDLKTINLDGQSTRQTKAVRKYMKRGYVHDLGTLSRLNRTSRHLYGNVLTDVNGAITGVLVIDNCADGASFDDFVLENIPYYLKILASTL